MGHVQAKMGRNKKSKQLIFYFLPTKKFDKKLIFLSQNKIGAALKVIKESLLFKNEKKAQYIVGMQQEQQPVKCKNSAKSQSDK